MKPAAVEVHIEELVLRGVGAGDRWRLAASLERELGSLLAQRVPESLIRAGRVSHIDAGRIAAPRHTSAQHVAADVARAIYRGLA